MRTQRCLLHQKLRWKIIERIMANISAMQKRMSKKQHIKRLPNPYHIPCLQNRDDVSILRFNILFILSVVSRTFMTRKSRKMQNYMLSSCRASCPRWGRKFISEQMTKRCSTRDGTQSAPSLWNMRGWRRKDRCQCCAPLDMSRTIPEDLHLVGGR